MAYPKTRMDGSAPSRKTPYWLVGAVLFGLSWPLTAEVNLSFLAWLAFVPMFVEIERTETIAGAVARALTFMLVAELVGCWWWFFGVPAGMMPLTWSAALLEALLQSVPLVLLYVARQWMPFRRALWMLVLFWPVWEWLYSRLPFAVSTFRIAHSQADAVWLVQYVDLFGAWAVTAWVLAFNVLLFRLYQGTGRRLSPALWGRAAGVGVAMLALPLGYAALRHAQLQRQPSSMVDVALIHTTYEAGRRTTEQRRDVVEHTLQLTDTTATEDARSGHRPDLYVWPEGIAEQPRQQDRAGSLLLDAVKRWQTPLLTGVTAAVPGRGNDDSTRTNRSVLISLGNDARVEVHGYDKRKLIPLWEGIPFYGLLRHIPAVQAYHRQAGFYEAGHEATLLPLMTRDGRTIHLGAPICHEQNFPGLWAEMADAGADVFILLAYESWFDDRGSQDLLTSITRLRSIETRRSTARCSNGGQTAFIDAFGRVHHSAGTTEGATRARVRVYTQKSFYTRHPLAFIWLCVVGLVGLVAVAARETSR